MHLTFPPDALNLHLWYVIFTAWIVAAFITLDLLYAFSLSPVILPRSIKSPLFSFDKTFSVPHSFEHLAFKV